MSEQEIKQAIEDAFETGYALGKTHTEERMKQIRDRTDAKPVIVVPPPMWPGSGGGGGVSSPLQPPYKVTCAGK